MTPEEFEALRELWGEEPSLPEDAKENTSARTGFIRQLVEVEGYKDESERVVVQDRMRKRVEEAFKKKRFTDKHLLPIALALGFRKNAVGKEGKLVQVPDVARLWKLIQKKVMSQSARFCGTPTDIIPSNSSRVLSGEVLYLLRQSASLVSGVPVEKIRSCLHLLRQHGEKKELVLQPVVYSSSLNSGDLKSQIPCSLRKWYVIVRGIADGHSILNEVNLALAPRGDAIAREMPPLRCVLAHPFQVSPKAGACFDGVLSLDSTETFRKMKWGSRTGRHVSVDLGLRQLLSTAESVLVKLLNS
jgi:hypothetical protein